MTKRCRIPILLACAAVGIACGSETVLDPDPPAPLSVALRLTPSHASILQGESVSVAVTLTRSSGPPGPVNLGVSGVPFGVLANVTNVQDIGLVTTATVTLNVSGSAIPGVYILFVHGRGAAVVEPTAGFALTVEPALPVSCPVGAVCEQWAVYATASSEYTTTAWSALQSTGPPNVVGCEDDGRAWASREPNGIEWLELEYHESVRPTEIRIHEVFGVSSIVKVEVKDGAGIYHTVFSAQPGRQACPRVLSIPVTGVSEMVKVIRVSFDQKTLNDWDEIDAVQLIGQPATPAGGIAHISGLYDLTAPITSFDPAWGDLTGCRYRAVLTLQQTNRSAFNGTYADLQIICPYESSDWTFTGFVTGSIDVDGQVFVQLTGGNHTWTSWYGTGKLASGGIAGDFGCCGHISGTFVVKPRPAG
jgi:hypothetical protein